MSIINDVPMVMVLLVFFKVIDLAHRRTCVDNQNFFQIEGLPNLLRYGVPFARLRRAGAPLFPTMEVASGVY